MGWGLYEVRTWRTYQGRATHAMDHCAWLFVAQERCKGISIGRRSSVPIPSPSDDRSRTASEPAPGFNRLNVVEWIQCGLLPALSTPFREALPSGNAVEQLKPRINTPPLPLDHLRSLPSSSHSTLQFTSLHFPIHVPLSLQSINHPHTSINMPFGWGKPPVYLALVLALAVANHPTNRRFSGRLRPG
jgi:hypothetical protein